MTLYTIKGKTDGFGAQYHAIMSGIAYCAYKGYTYVHTPFEKMDHNVNAAELNNFIGLKRDKEYPEASLKVEKYSKEVHDSKNPSEYYTPNVIKTIRDAYYSTSKPEIPEIDIAIHIRRGDVNLNTHPDRFTDNNTYIKIINALKQKYPTYKILIFSQGTLDDFKDFGLAEENFKLNENITNTFHSLVSSKVFVMSKSSLSYAAAILNKNTIYYIDFWHKPLTNWINVNNLITTGGKRIRRRTRKIKSHKRKRRL